MITCPKANVDELVAREKRIAEFREEREKKKMMAELNKPIEKSVKMEAKVDHTLK